MRRGRALGGTRRVVGSQRWTHGLQGLRDRRAQHLVRGIPSFEATSGEQNSTLRPPPAAGRRLFPLGRPSGEQDSIRSVVPGQETDPRFLRRETLEKPEIENECRRTAVRMEGVSSLFARVTCCDVAPMWQPHPRGRPRVQGPGAAAAGPWTSGAEAFSVSPAVRQPPRSRRRPGGGYSARRRGRSPRTASRTHPDGRRSCPGRDRTRSCPRPDR